MPSATLQALTLAPQVLPPPNLTDPAAAERWFANLPPAAQENLKARITAIVSKMPPVVQLDLQRYLAQFGASSPIPMPNGLGIGETFDWGGLIMGLASAGAGVFTAAQAARTQQRIASNQANSNATIQAALLQAQTETNNAILAAQRDAAIAAAAQKTERAPTVMWTVLGVGVLGLLGAGLYLKRRH